MVGAVLGLLVGAAFFFVPWDGREPPRLELVALGDDGRFSAQTAPPVIVDTLARRPRVPLVLGLRNTGGVPIRPGRLYLFAPARFQLRRGDELVEGTRLPGESLVRYPVEGEFVSVAPGTLPSLLPGADTLWVEPVLPRYECIVVADSVPELVPARLPDGEDLADLQLFWSAEGGEMTRRQTGLLRLRLDPAQLTVEPATEIPHGPIEVRAGGFQVSDSLRARLHTVGSHSVACGPPETALSLDVVLWETETGGRMLQLGLGGSARKILFDLDRDDVLELEMWDPDGDGRFEAQRSVAMPLPRFLLPPAAGSRDTVAADSLAGDSAAAPVREPAPAAPTRPGQPPAGVLDTTPDPVVPPRPDTAAPPPAPPAPPPPPPDTTPPDTIPPDTVPPPDTLTIPPEAAPAAHGRPRGEP